MIFGIDSHKGGTYKQEIRETRRQTAKTDIFPTKSIITVITL